MKKIISRLLIFFIGFPLAAAVVVLLPQKSHLAANIVVIILSALGAVEFAGILKKKNNVLSPVEAAFLGMICPLAMTLIVSFGVDREIIPIVFILGASGLLVSRIFSPEAKIADAAGRAAAGFAVMLYPGIFMIWIIRMARLPQSSMVILIFLLTVIFNDSVSWVTGMLFGKNNRGVIPVSPNKSVAGFIGGLAAAILTGIGGVLFLPGVFTSHRLPPFLAGSILGLVSGVAACLGDLGESALKRSSSVKDSGNLMPGRGGVLDSIDSLAMAAPVYFVAYWFLFT